MTGLQVIANFESSWQTEFKLGHPTAAVQRTTLETFAIGGYLDDMK